MSVRVRNTPRECPLPWRTWLAFCRCWRHRGTRRVLQIQLNTRCLHRLQESRNASRFAENYRSDLQNLPIFNWSPHRCIVWHRTTFLKRKKWKRRKKTKNCAEWWKRKDGVEEVEEAGLVNKHIFWRSAGGNALEDSDMNSWRRTTQ
jgi:hypothetical protein